MGFPDPIRLEVFKHLFAAIAEEMGVLLRKSSYSPNIKERRDFSCAVFNAKGEMIAQAAHIPVHLGSMPLSVKTAIREFYDPEKTVKDNQNNELQPGDVIILNDPYRGGTHLPDITLIMPVFVKASHLDKSHNATLDLPEEEIPSTLDPERLVGFVANRAHHADVGGMTPGSMGVSREIFQEGIIIPPVKLVEGGKLKRSVWDLLLANVRTPLERAGDLRAQLAANQRGFERFQDLTTRYGLDEVSGYMDALMVYSERMTRGLLTTIPDGVYSFKDALDPGNERGDPITIAVTITIRGDEATVDFTGSAQQQPSSVNAVFAITLSAVFYVFRSLIGLDVPNNSGCLAPIEVFAPEGSVVNAIPPAAVAAGNVETSQRIVDVLLGALAQADPARVPAASQGTMNNVTIGGWDPRHSRPFAYYETIGGGGGARPGIRGPSAVHSHMTNTLNTPVEALEFAYPLRIQRYEIRPHSGGDGQYPGGNGIRRDVEMLVDAQVSLLTERRELRPYGLNGGSPGAVGENILIRDGVEHPLPGKTTLDVQVGDVLSIRTPGGGGFGEKKV